MSQKLYQLYRVIGSMAVFGNQTNPGVGQSINFSFDLDYSNAQTAGYPAVVNKPIVASFGPLGEFYLRSDSQQSYVGFSSPIAEIDLQLFPLTATPPQLQPQPTFNVPNGASLRNPGQTGPTAPFFTGTDVVGPAWAVVYEFETPDFPIPLKDVPPTPANQ